MKTARPEFGTLLRRIRLEARLSQEALAERARISPQAVGALERGARSAPRADTLALLCEALGLAGADRAAFEAAAAASTRARVRTGPTSTTTLSLPHHPTSFVGRQRERDDVAALLAPGRCATLWGTGGVGKTRLALETARAVVDRYPDGVWFVELAPLSADADVARAVATATGVREEDGRAIDDSLVKALASKRSMLVLDNTEHVLLGTATLVERFLREVPSLTIACTSRERLRVDGENVYSVEPLPPEPAIALFLGRAASAGAKLDSSDETARTVAAICRRLDSNPLAIELAAARTPTMSVAAIENGLDDRFRLLARGNRTATPRQNTLHGVLDWSFNLASEIERAVLRRVAVFPASWTIDDAFAVAGAGLDRWGVIDAVTALVDRQLVQPSPFPDESDRRYRLLQTTAAYALERLADAGEFEATERLAAERMSELVLDAYDRWRADSDERPFRRIETASLRAALRSTIALESDVALGAAIAGNAAKYWDLHSMPLEGLRWIDEALDKLGGAHDTARLAAYVGRARLYRSLSRHRRTYDAARTAIELADRIGDKKSGAIARMQIVGPACGMGREAEARAAVEEGLALFEEIGDRRGRDSALWERTLVAYWSGDFAQLREPFEAYIARALEHSEPMQHLQGILALGEIEFGLGNVSAAIENARRAIDIARSIDDPLRTGTALFNLATFLVETGDIREASSVARESIEIFSAGGLDMHASGSAGMLAYLLSRCGHERDAARLLGYSSHRLDEAGSIREPIEKLVYDRTTTACAAALDAADFERLSNEGAALEDDEAIDLALDLADRIADEFA